MAEDPELTYVTFVNPQPEKGAAVFARIALELGRRRPEIPLLVVEGRGTSDGLARVPVDLSGLTNLNRMANTPDPRDFYRVSRVVLMPSLWRESLGRVAIEAMANGIPVLASDRGALPETLGDAGFVLTIPERYSSTGPAVPGPREVAPWVAIVERLWDDPEFEARRSGDGEGRGRGDGTPTGWSIIMRRSSGPWAEAVMAPSRSALARCIVGNALLWTTPPEALAARGPTPRIRLHPQSRWS